MSCRVDPARITLNTVLHFTSLHFASLNSVFETTFLLSSKA